VAKVILGMTMSLDGFINDRSGSVSALYPDLAALRDTEPLRESIHSTGAVVMGWNSFAMADDPDSIAGNYEYQVPIFVLTHEAPKKKPKETDRLTFTFVTDGIESAIAQAKAAAGDKDVTIIGAPSTARQCMRAGLADELHIDIMPVLLGGGLRLFEDTGMESVQLERLKVVELPAGRTHLRFRFVKSRIA
jgi:dihydrofolate reductase